MKGSAVRIRASAFRICGRFACDTGRGGSARGYKALAQAHPRLRSTPRWSGSASTTSTSNQIHRRDSRTPIEETMEAPHDVVKAGKARYVGTSSMYAWQFAKAQHVRRRRSSRCRTTTTDLPRGRAGDDPAVPRPGRRPAAVAPARARAARRQPDPRRRAAHGARQDGSVRREPLPAGARLRRDRPRTHAEAERQHRLRIARPRFPRSVASRPRRLRLPGSSTSWE